MKYPMNTPGPSASPTIRHDETAPVPMPPSDSIPARQATIHGLAIIGFIALMAGGLWLGVYSARFVPGAVGRLGTAAVYLGSIFTPNTPPSVAVVSTPTVSTTISFGAASSTVSKNTSAAPTGSKTVSTTAGTQTGGTYQIGGSTGVPTLSGLPDFAVTITAIGYLASASTDSFVASSTVPVGNRPAVKFTIKNIGTNVTGSWRFSANIPTQSSYIYQSQPQQSLNPGDSIDYTLGFDQPTRGANQTISIIANFDHAVGESNTNNDSASATITILGS